jgi:holo-[acyl-carrier protein] synthase
MRCPFVRKEQAVRVQRGIISGAALPWRSLANCRGCRGAAGAAEGPVIVGLGVDIAEVDRVRAALQRHGEAILKRLFTPGEIAYCESHRNKYERYAGRFAAKEAAMKALGTGWRRGVRWRDIEVLRLPGGRPTLELRGCAKEVAERLEVKNISLTITHSGNTALAQVIFEG